MNPHKMNKIDVSQMSEEDQKAFKMFGRLPQKNLLSKMQKEDARTLERALTHHDDSDIDEQDRKYFDSGDYMMSKAGVQSAQAPGTAIPTPEGLPHAFSPPASSSPNLQPIPSNPLAVPGSAPGASNSVSPISSPSPTKHTNSGSFSHAQTSAQPIPGAGAGTGHHASGTQGQEGSPFAQSPGVGVGIRPAGEEGGAVGHRRRPSVSMDGNRTSPPAPLRENSTPSSYPIHHAGGGSFGSSPVKTSLLARRMVDAQVEENE